VRPGTDERDRDRDAAGRPRNARPRDGLGRPLDRETRGEPVMPDDLRLEPGEAVLAAQRLIDAGRPFHAHEVLEATWKSAPPDQRDLWRGLAQLAVGLTHARRGNGRGAVALLRRGAGAVDSYLGGPGIPAAASARRDAIPASLDLDRARRDALRLADQIASSGVGSLSEADLRLTIAAGVD